MGFTSHRGFESRPLRSLRSATRPRAGGRYARRRLAPVAQLDRASVYGTEGHRFESCRARCESPADLSHPGTAKYAGRGGRAKRIRELARADRARSRVRFEAGPAAKIPGRSV